MTEDIIPPSHLSAALAGLVAKAALSIVSVRSHRSQSSGFAWQLGLVVTADEALAEESEFAVVVPGGDVGRRTSLGAIPPPTWHCCTQSANPGLGISVAAAPTEAGCILAALSYFI